MPSVGVAPDLTIGPTDVDADAMALPDFDTLYDHYVDFVWRNARRLGVSPAGLDDVVQDVFLVAHRKLGELTQSQGLRAWVFGILIRVVRAHRRTVQRKEPHRRPGASSIDPDGLPAHHDGSPLVAAERRDAVQLLYTVLSELDDAKREVFVLAELEELTEGQISEILEENPNTVHSRLRAARKQFDLAVERFRTRDEWRLR
jgi:RNA polymerase sigma-70 factor (ECF subfamily)